MEIIKGDTRIHYDKSGLVIENPDGLMTVGICQIGSGIQETRKVVYSRDRKMITGGIGSVSDFDEMIIESHGRVTCIVAVGDPLLDFLVFVDGGVTKEKLISYFRVLMESKDEILGSTLKFYDSKTILIVGRSGKPGDEIGDQIKDCLYDALLNVLKFKGVDVIEQLREKGVTLEKLVEAGMELCVGVEVNKGLENKLKEQLIKSLLDINVTTLLIAAMRVEEDLCHYRVKGIKIDDDPTHLYSDEVLGMAVANQIAGTKAIFNFKRYDEEKPGIIGKLGPMMDDVVAGLVAGSMSKIFEE